jgi:hypothetical protein
MPVGLSAVLALAVSTAGAKSGLGTELSSFALQRFRPESGDQLTLGGSDPEDRS